MNNDSKTELINRVSELFVEDEDFYKKNETELKDAAMIRAQYQEEIKEYLKSNQLQDQLERAVHLISQPHFDVLTEPEYKMLLSELTKITEDKLTHPTPEILALLNDKKNGVVPFQKIFGVSTECLLTIYKLGYYFFEMKQYDNATDIFTFLIALNPTVADFCTALGLCYQQNEKWQEALTFFTLASNLNTDHIAAQISAINCYRRFGNMEGARIHFQAIENICKQRPEIAGPWKDIIEFLRVQLQ